VSDSGVWPSDTAGGYWKTGLLHQNDQRGHDNPGLPPTLLNHPGFPSLHPYASSSINNNSNLKDFDVESSLEEYDEIDLNQAEARLQLTEGADLEESADPWSPQLNFGSLPSHQVNSHDTSPSYNIYHARNPSHTAPSIFPRSASRPTTPGRISGAGRPRLWNPQNHSPRRPSASELRRLKNRENRVEPPVPNIPVVHQRTRDEENLLTPVEQRFSRASFNSQELQHLEDTGDFSRAASPPLSIDSGRASLPGRLQQQLSQRYQRTEPPRVIIQKNNLEVMVYDSKHELPFPITSSNGDLEARSGEGALKRTPSKVTLPIGIGDRPATGNESHRDFEADSAIEWGPEHPCYPHLNPHVALDSPLYTSTRIIRVPRDWLVCGDLAPTFANVYPEVLEPVMSETEFRNVVNHINDEVVAAHDPWGTRAWIDSILGVMTFWLWDDFGMTGVKGRLRRLEEWLERWNRDVGAQEGVKIIPLRRTAYMTVSLQLAYGSFLTHDSSIFKYQIRRFLQTQLAHWEWHHGRIQETQT
jgi:hypothetical protein